MSIALVAGLGNPGREYEGTRHNAGWLVLDALAAKYRLTWRKVREFDAELARWDVPGGDPVWLAKPLTYMNGSGTSIATVARYHRIEINSIAVAYDDLTIELGRLKISVTGSSGGHNGVTSVLEHIGDGFARFRIGIGPKTPPEMDLKDFVLAKFSPEQFTIFQSKIDSTVQGLELLVRSGPDRAMNQLNRREPS